MKHKAMSFFLAIVFFLGLVACAGYYQVKDPTSGNTFFTRKISKIKKTGAISFDDAKTGSKVTLQSSKVKKITKKEYREALEK